MECPAPEGAPTLHDELLRGVNPYNLKFGAAAALVLGCLLGMGTVYGYVPNPLGTAGWIVAGVAAVSLFVMLTLTHTLAHGCMGWLFEQGLKAQCRGDFARAVRYLALAEKPGMDHYDPHGVALAALRDCRGRLNR